LEHGVFLSYRRSDTAGHAGRLSNDLARRFRRPVVFRDIDSIAAGSDFVAALEAAVARARVAIVLIGDTWSSATNPDGSRRLDDPADHVRREVAMALANPALTVVPVLVEGAVMPDRGALPEDLEGLARLQAIELSEPRWDYDVARLAKVLEHAGVSADPGTRIPRWLLVVLLVLLATAVAAILWCWRPSDVGIDRYTGLWYLPNGSYWTVRARDDGLWVEETHHESRQVWKQGAGQADDDGLSVQLELVFEQEPFHYAHRLRLSDDRQTLLGTVRRSDSDREASLALTRGGR
jgi:hypothetical protein